MRLTLHPPVLATSPALRLGAAVAASLALHAAVVLAPSGAPPGSLLGRSGAGSPLAAHIVAAPAPTPPAERASPAPPKPAHPAVEPEQAAARQATPPSPPPQAADAPALGLPGAPVYYLQSELDVRARMQGHVEPPYPETAPPDGGYVVLRLLISEEGRVERVLVVVAEPEGYFEQAADAFAAARFFPGRRGGAAVKSQTFIELKFHPLVPTDAAASGTAATDAATTAANENP